LTLRLVGVYGGTFNPIHVGHLRAAEEIAEAFGLARVLFVPSAVPPHKADAASDGIAPAALRLDWVQRAVADNPGFVAEPIEVERGGASYLVDTLGALRERLARSDEEPVFLVGSDAFAEMGAWREPAALFRLAHYAVMVRPPRRTGSLADWLPAAVRDEIELTPDGRAGRHRAAGTWLRLVEIAGFDVSASDLRARLRDGRSVRYLLPESIRNAVLASGAYRATPGAPPGSPAGTGDGGSRQVPPPDGTTDEPRDEPQRTQRTGGRSGVQASR
jgi:nicotinate-nucleotide adenylyltransferase